MATRALSRLHVHLDFAGGTPPVLLGEILWAPARGVAAFEWSANARAAGLRVSPIQMAPQAGVVLAPAEPFGGLHPFVADCIPDGFGLRLMNNALRAAGFALEDVTPVDRLAWVGHAGVGALTFTPAMQTGASDSVLTDIAALGAQARLADIDDFKKLPKSVLRAGGSALGARPKFWASLHADGRSILLNPAAPSSPGFTPCLVKFAPTRGDQNEPYLEAACLDLASKHGVNAAAARLLHHSAGAALAVERFDRTPAGQRVHVQSLAALISHNFRHASAEYEHLLQASKLLSGTAQSETIYRQACFNVALSIKDDHSRNFAFLMDAAGNWSLSPAFDLCPSDGIHGWHTTSLCKQAKDIRREHLLQFAQDAGLSEATGEDGIEQARSAASEFEQLAISLGAKRASAQGWAKKMRQIDKQLAPSAVAVSVPKAQVASPRYREH